MGIKKATVAKSAKQGNAAAYPYKKPDWYPPGLEEVHAFWLPEPWDCWMAPVLVTAEMATEWLSLNVENNRNVIDTLVEQLFYDLTDDKWRATHQGVAFNRACQFFDGQNRLNAIKQAGDKPAWLLVFWGVDDGTMQVVDTGRSRSVRASAQIAGKDYGTRHISTMNRALQHLNYSRARLSRSRLFDMIEEHREGLDWVLERLPSFPWSRADVTSAFLRAYYHVPHETLARVAEILKKGIPEHEYDSPIIALRDLILIGSSRAREIGKMKTPSQLDMERYFKTLRAITAVVRMEKLDKLIFPMQLDYYQEVYPFPESVAEWKAKDMPRAGRHVFWPQKAGAS